MKKSLSVLALLCLSIACGNDTTNRIDDNEPSTATAAKSLSEDDKSPCTLLSEIEIKEILSIPEETPTEIRDVMRTYPTCFYKWETIFFTETKIIVNREMTMDYPAEMTIVLVENADDKMYNTAIKVYKDGEKQEEIGDMATWGGKMSQLTFLSKGNMIHLYLKRSGDQAENKTLARSLALQITKNL